MLCLNYFDNCYKIRFDDEIRGKRWIMVRMLDFMLRDFVCGVVVCVELNIGGVVDVGRFGFIGVLYVYILNKFVGF